MIKQVLGIIVVYSKDRVSFAVESFKSILHEISDNFKIVVVSNSQILKGDVLGSNSCGEFSGWAEGLSAVDCSNVDLFVFANDTFATSRRFTINRKNAFIHAAKHSNTEEMVVIGEVCWGIEHQCKQFLIPTFLRWLRTDIFACTAQFYLECNNLHSCRKKIHDECALFNYSSKNHNRNHAVEQRVSRWLDASKDHDNWPKLSEASTETLELKRRCVIKEQEFGLLITDMNTKIYNIEKSYGFIKLSLFEIIYFIQTHFSKINR